MIKKHNYYKMLISRYKDNDLDKNEIYEMKQHLLVCKSCNKFFNEINTLSSIIADDIVLSKSNINKLKFPTNYIYYAATILLTFSLILIIKYNSNHKNLIAKDVNIKSIPLSTYFNDMEDNEHIMMSAYLYYVDKED